MAEVLTPIAALEERFLAATDAAFRVRATAEYRRVASWVRGRVNLDAAAILDFGCGEGVPAASFAARHPNARITAYDVAPIRVSQLRTLYQREMDESLPRNLDCLTQWEGVVTTKYDLIYAWSVFEHIAHQEMVPTLERLRDVLNPGGCLFINCEPLFYSPHGSHLRRYLNEPWRHLLDSMSTLKDIVISEAATERDAREWQQFTSLNRYTHYDLRAAFEEAGFEVARTHLSKTSMEVPAKLTRLFHEEALRVEAAQFLLFLKG